MNAFQKLEKGLWHVFDKRNLGEKYRKRLEWELREIDVQGKAEYFLKLFSEKNKFKNTNNIIVPWLLGICDDFNVDVDPKFVQGDMPDIDVDYLSEVRDYLKNKWALETFGEEYVCNISNYTTFGMKSALIDMARVHDNPREEILELTKNLDSKDEDGNVMTWESAMELYPKLKKYCEDHPEATAAAHKLINRNRGMGQHAGGLIISSVPLSDMVPLVKRKDNPQASAWVEGLNGQDLQPVGLVKFDLLVISNLKQISTCCELVKKRKNIKSICANNDDSDWTDVSSWRNDQKSLAMANEGDLKCIFQFDSEGIRRLVKAGGVDRFEDLVAYTALYRPGPLGMLMHERYTKRKKEEEEYTLHPLIEPILGNTYGVMVFQEQIMKILNIVGEIPLRDCEVVRKAISKKKAEAFKKYEIMFIENGQKNLDATQEEVQSLWEQIKSFAEYGFNMSHSVAYTYVSSRLLYLKAHHPQEFYAAVLSCETLSDKIKDYKIEARRHDVEMEKVDINKSKETFSLVDDVIYYGLSNIKGVGEIPAKKIVDNQPYANFEDFLFKFGTDASILKALVGLRCFKDADPITLWKFYEHYKSAVKKIEDKRKRFIDGMENYEEDFSKICVGESRKLTDLVGDNVFDDPEWKKYDIDEIIETEKIVESTTGERRIEVEYIKVKGTDDFVEVQTERFYKKMLVKKTYNKLKELKKIWARRQRAIKKFDESKVFDLPKLVDFNSDDHQIDKTFAKELRSVSSCELKYYGFAWEHDLEKSSDFKGYTFQILREHENCIVPVEIKVLSTKKNKTKNGKDYISIEAEDAMGEKNRIFFWEEDVFRWEEELKKDNLLRVRLSPPSGGFNGYSLERNLRDPNKRWQQKYPTKELDFRVIVLKNPASDDEKYQTDDEVLKQFEKCLEE